jgi:hypothetical protein
VKEKIFEGYEWKSGDFNAASAAKKKWASASAGTGRPRFQKRRLQVAYLLRRAKIRSLENDNPKKESRCRE